MGALGRLRVTGEVAPELRGGPLILAANHIGPFDPVVLTAACRSRGLAPRFLAMAELFRVPVLGRLMRAWGHLPVDRRGAAATLALPAATRALADGAVVLVYPEGGIGRDPGLWPVRARTGTARLALATGVPVVPVAHWGAHEVVPYAFPRGLLRTLPRAIVRRPVLRVHFGAPVDLSGLRPGVPGDARRASARILAAITAHLAPLRPDEPHLPRYRDPTRPSG